MLKSGATFKKARRRRGSADRWHAVEVKEDGNLNEEIPTSVIKKQNGEEGPKNEKAKQEDQKKEEERAEEERKKREEKEKALAEKITTEVRSLPKDDPIKCEGQIRALEKKISAFHDAELKDQLLHELKSVSFLGLSEELNKMMEENGLALEGLTLVMKHLTTVPELAQYLYLNSKDVLSGEGLDIIKRRLRPGLELLGGLKAKGIDVEQPWVDRLTKRAPSLQSLSRIPAEELESLCKKSPESQKPSKPEEEASKGESQAPDKPGEVASEGEMDEVRRLAKVAEAYNRQNSVLPPDLNLPQENPDAKAIDEEKLEKAKELMNEAKAMATEQSDEAKKATKEKMDEMMKVLELPSDWNKQDTVTPDQMFKDLDAIIDQYSTIVEAAESYKSDLEVVAKASGGRVLSGIYHSEYEIPQTAGRPVLLMPANVTLTNPNDAMNIRYLKFEESRAAANYVHTVKSSSTSIGFSVGGFYGGFVGEVKGAYSSQQESDETRSVKNHTTSCSVLQSIWTPKKCFYIEQENMKLSETALRMAKSIVKACNKKDVSTQTKTDSNDNLDKNNDAKKYNARRFLEMFGSHLPAGVQTLGGVFFSIANAESEQVQKTTTMINAATEKLQSQMSFGFLGGAFGIVGSGEKRADQEDDEKVSYTYTVHAMGPAAPNPTIFQKLLSYNSTWALIDRGPPQAFIPIWELLRDIGSDYEEAAQILEETWHEEEHKKKETSEKLKKFHDKRKKEEDVRVQLKERKEEYTKRGPEKDYGFWPSNGAFIYSAFKLTEEQAYDKAMELVMKDPHLNICELYLRDESKKVYTLKCWKASREHPMTFGQSKGYHVLFYSEIAFKWRNLVPVKEKCDDKD